MVLHKIKPQQILIMIILKNDVLDIPLNAPPNKLRPPEKVKTIAAKMLKTPINSVCTDAILFFASFKSSVAVNIWLCSF